MSILFFVIYEKIETRLCLDKFGWKMVHPSLSHFKQGDSLGMGCATVGYPSRKLLSDHENIYQESRGGNQQLMVHCASQSFPQYLLIFL